MKAKKKMVSGSHMVRNMGRVCDTQKRAKRFSYAPFPPKGIESSLTEPAKIMEVIKKKGI